MNLREADLKVFQRLSIPVELIERAGIERVTDHEARERYGIRGGGDMGGIAFLYFDPHTMSNGRRRHYVRIRRDFPELEDGKTKKKYVAPYGDRKHLYFPPSPDFFADVTVPIILVEAEKSVLAFAAWSERTGRKILALALGGHGAGAGKLALRKLLRANGCLRWGQFPISISAAMGEKPMLRWIQIVELICSCRPRAPR
jgi:hypothetical protein